MKVIINIPTDYFGSTRDAIDEVELTLAPNPDLEEMVQAFKTVLYAQTYHSDTIDRAFGEDYE